MAAKISVFEVLEIAQRMEGNGADFYRQAAKLRALADERALLERLAAAEEEHRKIFAAMQASRQPVPVPEESADDMFESTSRYLTAVIDTDNLEGSRFARYIFNGKETISTVVLMGIDLEKETILYYLGMKDLFRKTADIEVFDKIILEERNHLADLVGEYRRLEKSGK